MYITIRKNQAIFIIIFSFILISVVCYLLFGGVFAGNTNWGLSFKEKGKVPLGNASNEYLKQFNSYFLGKEDKIYLTFDAGYENGYTETILDTLKKHNVKATFFVVGTYITSEPKLIQRMVDEGHIVGNHTQSHPNMSKISTMDDFKKEIEQVEVSYKACTGKDMPKYYRPPQGIYSESNLKMANELGYKTVFWSLAYVDWYKDKQPTKEEAFSKLLPRVHNGAIILLHSTSKTNALMLDEFISTLKSQGYTFGNLDEM